MTHNNQNPEPTPFFARYLEGQIGQELSEEMLNEIAGGNGDLIQTKKFPSDAEEFDLPAIPSLLDVKIPNLPGSGGGSDPQVFPVEPDGGIA
ncbi:microviridin/marinostatin family tricyclic proteinase inhibitor [Kovacikia minuta CCNUW1]|uniref:microviridin/marinostatin family tricyclic proteinase inhibitor n=1 Tax=Kovacikia minuta TaxID=2931930 RepID=UPI001CC973A2|nr:microviridin/marinostatin family tricyclic proteinase inhibitor [Kovacikia minuta]UBF25845.1 microviridin/marinostatin family tricyclic proteinase inhibitor [Kovacikia minuta CCNUW1]